MCTSSGSVRPLLSSGLPGWGWQWWVLLTCLSLPGQNSKSYLMLFRSCSQWQGVEIRMSKWDNGESG